MTGNLDVLLVNPNNRILSPYAGIEPPLWAGLIASDLRAKGKSVAILDAEAMDYDAKLTAEIVRQMQPREVILVVMGNNPSVSSTPKMIATKELVDYLIGEVKLSITGLHPSALPKETRAELGIEVLRGKIFEGTPDLPYDLFPMDKYIAHSWQCLDGSSRKPYASTYTSLGCPMSCSFCNIHALYNWQHRVWYRDIDSIMHDIDKLVVTYGVRNIKFWDELFALNKERVEVICDKLIERGYDLNIWAYARVDTVNLNMLKKMRKAGIQWLGYGIESGSDEVLSGVNKKATREKSIKAIQMTHEAGINATGNFILGLPNETYETMQETVNFAKSLDLDWYNVYVFEPLPGSKLYQKGMNWRGFGQFSSMVQRDEIREFRDRAFTELFCDANYLDRMGRKFGRQAIEQIMGMIKFGKPITRA